MRIMLIILLVCATQVFALDSHAQNAKISLSANEMKLEDIILQVENQSKYRFAYNKNEIDVNKKYSIKIKDAEIEDLLNYIFSKEDISYTFVDRQIVLSPSKDPVILRQQKSISGKVIDSSGSPLPGVTVVVKSTTQGTVTNTEGEYLLTDIPEDAILQFSFVGMKTQEITVAGNTFIDVIMQEDAIGIEEVVAVGYGIQKRANLTGSVATINTEKLNIAPVTSASNSLAGKLPGLIAVQRSGQPGNDEATLSIRGFGSPLVIVDGIEADFNSIDPSQIKSVSVLKDGAASIYGSRAGNGVILVTTKRGGIQKPTITFSSSLTGQGITYMPKMASSGQLAEMEREKHLQAGKPEATAPYTEEEIQKYYDGTDPQYPNTDWYNILIKKWAPQQQHNVSVRGGSESIKYFGYLGYSNQESFWKHGNGGDYKRYNFQSNVDFKITESLSLQFDVAATWEDTYTTPRGQNTGSSGGGLWQDFWATQPMYPAYFLDETKNAYAGVSGVGGVHLSSNTAITGYDDEKNNIIKGTINLNYKFKSIDGLSAKSLVNILQRTMHSKYFSKPYDFYTYDIDSEIYTKTGSLSTSTLTEAYSEQKVITSQFYLNYEKNFAKKHRFKAMAIAELIDSKNNYLNATRTDFLSSEIDYLFAGSTENQSNDGSASEMGRMSYIGKINYSYKDKYLFESILRADASAKFSPDTRWGYFPSVSLGWVISEEAFLKKFTSIDRIKLRGSFGLSGRDAVGNFQYLAGYTINGNTYLLDGSAQTGILATGIANPNLTWENNTIYNLGLDFSLFKNKLFGEADIFYRTREGIPATKQNSLPSTFGADLPTENINSLNNRGLELLIGTSGKISDLSWNISANVSWSRAKWDHYEEPEYTDPDQDRIYRKSGRWTDRAYGYVSDGLFTSQEEIDALEFDQDQKGNTSLRPGDIKYVDVNNDKVLDWKDQVEIGFGTTPHWMVGFNANIEYKNFDFAALFQGALGYYHKINLERMSNPTAEYYNLRWTEDNNDPNAFIPRLGGATTNSYTSDHFYKKSGYLRLKAINIGYNLPEKWIDDINLEKVRFYFAGTNLFTINPLQKFGVDPEAPSNGDGFYYPQQRTITLGVTITL